MAGAEPAEPAEPAGPQPPPAPTARPRTGGSRLARHRVWVGGFSSAKSRWRSRLVTGVLGVATAGMGLYAGVRFTGLDWFTPLAQVMSFTAYAVPAGLLLTLVTVAARRWRTAVVAGVITVALLAVVAPRAIGDPPDPPAGGGAASGGGASGGGVPLRVMTVNLWHGGATDEVMRLVRRERPDVLSLQEVTPEALDRLERAGLGRLLPYHAARPWPGVAGTALYGRTRFTGLRTVDRRTRFDMARAFTIHRGVKLDVVAAHPSPPVPGAATRAWHRELGWLPRPRPTDGAVTVLAGDFNATLDHASLRRLISTGYVDAADAAGAGLIPTWRAGWVPPVTIDHILVERGTAVHAVRVYDVGASDHRAVVADLTLPS